MALTVLSGERAVVTRTLDSATAVARSPYSGAMQVQDWGGTWWAYEIEIGPFRPTDAKAKLAQLTALRGPVNRFIFADPSIANAASLGTPLVNGASQTGDSLVTDGWSAGAEIKAGWFVSLGTDTATRLYMVTADVTADGSGNATLSIAPNLRTSPANNDPVEYAAPKVQLRLTSPVPTRIASGAYYTFSLSAVEAL